MFTDPLFTGLKLRDARIAIAWNALHVRWQRQELDAWMAAAQAAGVRPLVTFDHARSTSERKRKQLPRPEQLAHELRMLRRRYPFVRQFAAWNEANYCGEKTCHRPQLVAAYYRALKLACPSCKILAAELLDSPNVAAWARAFRSATKVEPRYWGLHNYIDANRFTTTYTKSVLAATKGELWLTETGGLVARRNNSRVRLPESTAHAAKATRFVFEKLVRVDPRIKRVYVYHWRNESRNATWDSALIARNGQRRPAYDVLRDRLRRLRVSGRLG